MKREIYLDWAATSYKKPKEVIDAVTYYMEHIGVSSGRGAYRRAFAADNIVYECRKEAASLLGVSDPARIVLTSGATESINLALKGFLQSGDHVVTTSLEHNAILRTLHRLKEERNISYTIVNSDEYGYFNLDDFSKSITKKTTLFAITHASNVIGTVLPIEAITKLAHSHGIKVLLDAAQSAGSIEVDAATLDVDFIAFAGHKSLLGLAGTGGLYIREFPFNKGGNGVVLLPLKEGGTGSDSKSLAMPEKVPERFEAGTLNYPGISGLREGIKYVRKLGVAAIREKELAIIKYTIEQLTSLKHVKLYGCKNPADMVGVFAFNVEDIEPDKVSYILDTKHNIMVRSGLHCAPLAHAAIRTQDTGAVRASIGYTTTKEEIDYFIEALRIICT